MNTLHAILKGNRVLLVCLALLLLSGCQYDDGEDGASSISHTVTISPGDVCAQGGYLVQVGLDGNNNNVLDADEVQTEEALCDGTNGSLVLVQDESEGLNCPAGGKLIQNGIDDDNDAVLDAEEIDSSQYICNGINGDLANTIFVDAANANCTNTAPGTKIAPNCDIQSAIFHAKNGNNIFVAKGTYKSIIVFKPVALFGGYDGSTWLRDLANNVTTIMDDNGGAVVEIGSAAAGTVFDGFALHGFDFPASNAAQAGINFSYGGMIVGADATIRNNRITIDATKSSSPNSTFGLVISSGANNFIASNNVINVGGKMSFGAGQAVITDRSYGESLWFRNLIVAGDAQSGVQVFSFTDIEAFDVGNALLINNTIYAGNSLDSAYFDVIGVATYGKVSISLMNNNIFVGNGLTDLALSLSGYNVTLLHNNLWGSDAPAVRYTDSTYNVITTSLISDINNCTLWLDFNGCNLNTSGNTMQDPLFDLVAGDYRLMLTSLLIDAGVDSSLFNKSYLNVPDKKTYIDVGYYETADNAVDITPPVLSETQVVISSSISNPEWRFSSSEIGFISYSGSCSSAQIIAITGENRIKFNTLASAIYSDCSITVTDLAGNISAILVVTPFNVLPAI